MKRYLLLDASRSLCKTLSADISGVTGGAIRVLSMSEPEASVLFDPGNPNWRPDPTLVEVTENEVRSFTGIELHSRMLTAVGAKGT